MFIKLCLGNRIFRAFRVEDIVSIDPVWHAEDCFSNYDLYLSTQQVPIELTQSQGEQLIYLLQYKSVTNA